MDEDATIGKHALFPSPPTGSLWDKHSQSKASISY